MKKIINFIFFIIFLSLNSYSNTSNNTVYTISVGASIPGKEVFSSFPSSKIETNDSIHKFINSELNEPELGYIFNIKFGFYLSSELLFNAGIGYYRYNSKLLSLYYSDEKVGSYKVVNTIVPITIDLNYYILKSFVNIYLISGLNYNLINQNLLNIESKYTLKLNSEVVSNNIGMTLGIGTQLSIQKSFIIFEINSCFLDIINNKFNYNNSLLNFKLGIRF